jgi:hypothetical protein
MLRVDTWAHPAGIIISNRKHGCELKYKNMPRLKRKSNVFEEALKRLAGLQSISPTLDLGNGLTAPLFADEIARLENLLNAYNILLAQSDEAQNKASAQEKIVRELSERMREGIGSKFGHDSNEYEKAGSIRKSERKRPIRKKKNA